MKKYVFIIALVIIALAAVNANAAPPAGDPTIVLVKLDTSFPYNGKPMTEKDIAFGRGWIVGEDFKKVMNAKEGSFIRLTVSGTANLNWQTIGAVGVKKVDVESKRINFKPKAGGTYIVDIDIKQLLVRIKGETEAIGVNVWGDHTINKVELYLY
jgi:hypothetical protein